MPFVSLETYSGYLIFISKIRYAEGLAELMKAKHHEAKHHEAKPRHARV
jgi:hypothetical protein